MEILLDQLEDSHTSWEETLAVDPRELGDASVESIGEVSLRGHLDETPDGWVLRIALRYHQTLACVRCLEPVDAPVDLETALLLVLEPEEIDEEERELDRDDLGVLVLEEPIIDTRDPALEQIQLAIPMKPLCKPDCAGLCGQCGQNLNQGECECEEEVDPRWAALQALRSVN